MKRTLTRVTAIVLTVAMLLCLTACDLSFLYQDNGRYPDEVITMEGEGGYDDLDAGSDDFDIDTGDDDDTNTGETVNLRPNGVINGGVSGNNGGTTTTVNAETAKKPIRILSIGHSFSKDAMQEYLWTLLTEAGYDYVVLGILFTPSCSISEQWDRMQGKAYHDSYAKTNTVTGKWVEQTDKGIASAIKDEDWDIITMQPDPDYGAEIPGWEHGDYDHLMDCINWINIRKTNKNARLMWHMTWSFAKDCNIWCFSTPFKRDQVAQYNAFVDSTLKYVVPTGKFTKIIPAGTSIQNARETRLGDVFNMPGNNDPNGDGYHLNDRGDYVAALTWYATITGKSATTAWCPEKYKDDFKTMATAVDQAIAKPFEITK